MIKTFLFSILLLPFSLFAKEQLTLYAAESFASEWGPGPMIKQAFEAQCDCELKIVGLSDSAAILNRLRLEGKNSQADVVLSLDNNLIASATATDLFEPYHFDKATLTLPITWENHYFVPYDYGYFAFIYNTETIKTPPRSMNEFLNSEQKWRIIYQDPRTSTTGLGLLTWLETLYNGDAAKAWQQLSQRTVTVTKGWSESYGLFLKGEADFVLSYSTSPAYHLITENDPRYAAALFDEGHYLQIEVAGILRQSKHQELAKQFMQFMISPDFQRHIAIKNWMYPVIDVALPETFAKLPKPTKVLLLPSSTVEQSRSIWIKQWQNAVIH